ncbi:MAG: ABC transporter ATP-binding protein [Sphaerochaeta sp.]
MSGELLSVEGLSYTVDSNRRILHDLSFSITKGSFTFLGGRNGAGKSALLRIIKGLYPITTGKISLNGSNVTAKAKHRLREIGLVFQDADAQIVGQSVEKDLRFGLENINLPLAEQNMRIDEVLSLLGMEAIRHQNPYTLSGGEKRKLAIAGVLVMQPSLILLDEPFANLDYPSVVSTLTLLLDLQKRGHTILLVSHEIEKCLAHADHLLLLDHGTLVIDSSPKEALTSLGGYGIYTPKGKRVEELTWLMQ